jgi:hypothetical protein
LLGKLGVLGANLHGYRCTGMGDIAYRPSWCRSRALRLGHPVVLLGAGRAHDVPDLAYGSDTQKAEWLPRLAGEAVAASASPSPTSAPNPGGMVTARRARRPAASRVTGRETLDHRTRNARRRGSSCGPSSMPDVVRRLPASSAA